MPACSTKAIDRPNLVFRSVISTKRATAGGLALLTLRGTEVNSPGLYLVELLHLEKSGMLSIKTILVVNLPD